MVKSIACNKLVGKECCNMMVNSIAILTCNKLVGMVFEYWLIERCHRTMRHKVMDLLQ